MSWFMQAIFDVRPKAPLKITCRCYARAECAERGWYIARVNSCMTAATSRTSWATGISSLYCMKYVCATLRARLIRTRLSGPIPEYTTPMLPERSLIFRTVDSSIKVDGSFFSVARTTPLVALIPREIAPAETAFRAYSIWTSLPLGLKVVREKEYCTQTLLTPPCDLPLSFTLIARGDKFLLKCINKR